ncbi:MAG: hypothetical protein J6Q68_04845 [Clostridia bacterium]|nr:hypothetical protein [Clostridia bacterium]
MKKTYLFCTRIKLYLIEIPLIILLVLTCSYNSNAQHVFKLYPLIVFLSLGIIFILVYFFRVISLSFEEVRYHGLFSSRDHAPINKDKEVILTLRGKRRLTVELFGNDGKAPELDWIKDNENYKITDIYLFRGKAIAGKQKVKRILSYYGVDDEGRRAAIENDEFSADYEFVSLKSKKAEGVTEIRIKMKETV